jgi:hypothetical protein
MLTFIINVSTACSDMTGTRHLLGARNEMNITRDCCVLTFSFCRQFVLLAVGRMKQVVVALHPLHGLFIYDWK